ncbi:MAG TPA: hypothetical protein DCE56_07245, partial [Cyanobacteria bacterium UBA8553]|nr:hypothetical protein [Cyanobacteria bacterium UBA8553]
MKFKAFSTFSSYLMFAGGGMLCLFLWVKSEAIDFQQHSGYVDRLRQIQAVDARINQNVLLAKNSLLTYYDPIVNELTTLRKLQTELKQPPTYIDQVGREELSRLIENHIQVWQQKEKLIQKFQSQNAILRNSLSYLPIAITGITKQKTTNPDEAARLTQLLQNILLFNLSSDEKRVPQIKQQIQQILAANTLPAQRGEIKNAIAHARIILNSHLQVDNLVRTTMALPTSKRSEAIAKAYDRRYKQALDTTNAYRLWFYLLFTVLLMGVATSIILQLRASAIALRYSEAKFRNIFENSQVGIFRVRVEDGLILDINQRFLDMFGYNYPGDLIGVKRTTEFYVNPNERQQMLELLRTRAQIQNFEAQFRQRDGAVFWGLLSARFSAQEGCIEGVIADISDRKRTEQALQASEAELRGLFAAMTELILVYNQQGRCLKLVSTNPDLLSIPSEEQLNRTIYECLPQEQAEFRHRYIQQALETQRTLNIEYTQAIANRTVWFSASISPLSDNTVLWAARDISDLKQATEALRQSEATNRALISAIPDLLLRVKGDGTYLDILGSGKSNRLNVKQLANGTTLYDPLPPDRAQERSYYIQQALKTGEIQIYEHQLVNDGAIRDEEVRIVASRNNEVLVMVRDITDRKRTERALQHSERKFRNIFENSQVGIFRIRGEDGLLWEANQRLATMMGYDCAAEMIGLMYADDFYVDANQRQQVVETLQTNGEIQNFEAQFCQRDGAVIWGLLSARLDADAGYIEGVITDICDRKR